MFVAITGRVEREGLRPYRRRVKKLFYEGKMDAIYLIGRDDKFPAVGLILLLPGS